MIQTTVLSQTCAQTSYHQRESALARISLKGETERLFIRHPRLGIMPYKPSFSASATQSLAGYRLPVQQTTVAEFDMIQHQVQAAVSPKPHNQTTKLTHERSTGGREFTGNVCGRRSGSAREKVDFIETTALRVRLLIEFLGRWTRG